MTLGRRCRIGVSRCYHRIHFCERKKEGRLANYLQASRKMISLRFLISGRIEVFVSGRAGLEDLPELYSIVHIVGIG